eukprot:4897271-Prymnesium_polylepis.1
MCRLPFGRCHTSPCRPPSDVWPPSPWVLPQVQKLCLHLDRGRRADRANEAISQVKPPHPCHRGPCHRGPCHRDPSRRAPLPKQ